MANYVEGRQGRITFKPGLFSKKITFDGGPVPFPEKDGVYILGEEVLFNPGERVVLPFLPGSERTAEIDPTKAIVMFRNNNGYLHAVSGEEINTDPECRRHGIKYKPDILEK